MVLDVRTMGIFSAISPLILGIIMLIYLRERKVYAGFGRWVLANFGLGIGFLLVSLRGFIPDLLSIVLGNAVVVYCTILIYEGIRCFYDYPPFSRSNYMIFGVYLLMQSYFTYSHPDINARIVLSSLTVFILLLRSGMVLVQGAIPGLERSSHRAGHVVIFTAIFPFTRAASAFLQPEPIDFFSDELNSWFSVVFIVSIVVWTFYFFFLTSARLELDLETARAELDLVSRTDPLTSLYNRRHFMEHAEMEFQRARRYGSSLSFIMLDADEFKMINDTYGHSAGDMVLRSISATLREELRPFDLLSRFGGDEFTIMLVDADGDSAYSIAERIRKVVARTPVSFDGMTVKIQLSVGVASYTRGDEGVENILRRADTALYHAKHHGRNRVKVA